MVKEGEHATNTHTTCTLNTSDRTHACHTHARRHTASSVRHTSNTHTTHDTKTHHQHTTRKPQASEHTHRTPPRIKKEERHPVAPELWEVSTREAGVKEKRRGGRMAPGGPRALGGVHSSGWGEDA